MIESVTMDLGLQLVHQKGIFDPIPAHLVSLVENPLYLGVFMAARWSMFAVGFPDDEPEENGDRYLMHNGKKPLTLDESIINFRYYIDRYLKLFKNKPTSIFLQVPRYPFFPKKEAIMKEVGGGVKFKLRSLPLKTLKIHKEEHRIVNDIFDEIAYKNSLVKLLDASSILCPEDVCLWHEESNLLYHDDDHLSVYGAKKLYNQIKSVFLSFYK